MVARDVPLQGVIYQSAVQRSISPRSLKVLGRRGTIRGCNGRGILLCRSAKLTVADVLRGLVVVLVR
jgi:hypothetical protein